MMQTMLLVGGALFLFGLGYNWFVARLEKNGHDRGYTAFLVVVGTAVTLVGYACLAGLEQAGVALLCFVASGAPMIIGSMWRHVQGRAYEEQKLVELVKEFMIDGQA